MNVNEFAVWRNTETNNPICDIKDAQSLTDISPSLFYQVDIFSEVNAELNAIFNSVLVLDLWENKKTLILSADKAHEFNWLFSHFNITNKPLFYKIVGIINVELSFCKYLDRLEKQAIKEGDSYKVIEKQLKGALAEYSNGIFTNSSNEIPFNSITFRINDKPYKVDNEEVVKKIFETLSVYYKFSFSGRYNLPENDFKMKVAANLYKLFIEEHNVYYYAKSNNSAYRIIAEIFDLAGFNTSFDAVKQWFTREKDEMFSDRDMI